MEYTWHGQKETSHSRGCPKQNRVKGIHELGGLCRAQRCGRLSFKDQRLEVPQGISDLEICSSPHMAFPKEGCLDAIIFLHKPFPPISKEWRITENRPRKILCSCSWPRQCGCSLPVSATLLGSQHSLSSPHLTTQMKSISSKTGRNKKSRDNKDEKIFQLEPSLF